MTTEPMGTAFSLAFVFTVVFLSYCAGRLMGQHDATKPAIKHDGRRFVIRALIVGAVCSFPVWYSTFPWYQGLMTWVAAGAVMSIGVRWGWNLARNLDRNYLGVTSRDDRWFVHRFAMRCWNPELHAHWYNDGGLYRENVHRAGAFRTLLELLIMLATVVPQFFL